MYGQQFASEVGNPVSMQQTLSSSDLSDLLQHLSTSRDKQVYIELFRHFAPKVKAYILRLGVPECSAEELMQETMLAVWRKAHMYNRAKAAASTWIFTLARNQSIDWMRKQKYPEYGLDEWLEEADDGPHQGEQLLVSERINRAIEQLPQNQAQVLVMSFIEGRSHAEIATQLELPLGSVKSRIRLAAEKLREIWRRGV